MRLFLLASLVFVASLPLGGDRDASAASSGARGEVQIAAPAAPGIAIAPSVARADAFVRGSGSVACAAPDATTLAGVACAVAATPLLRHEVTRWLQGHATSSAVP